MNRRSSALILLACLGAPAHAHGTGVELYYLGAELLILIVAAIVVLLLRGPWWRQLLALAILVVATAATYAFGLIPPESEFGPVSTLTWACIPVGAVVACLVARRRPASSRRTR